MYADLITMCDAQEEAGVPSLLANAPRFINKH